MKKKMNKGSVKTSFFFIVDLFINRCYNINIIYIKEKFYNIWKKKYQIKDCCKY